MTMMKAIALERFGEPDVPTPEFIREAAKAALDEGSTFYLPNAGLPILRQTIVDYMNALYGTQFAPDNIVVTASGTATVPPPRPTRAWRALYSVASTSRLAVSCSPSTWRAWSPARSSAASSRSASRR